MKEIIYERPINHFSLLTSMRERDQLCDVTIEVNGQKFRAHKNILAATIPYFQAMFLNNFQEHNTGIITMNNLTTSNVEILIAFAYTGKITIKDDNVESLIKDADYLELTGIKQKCEEFLLSTLRIQNVYKIYHLAVALSCSSLKEEACKFMCQNIHSLVRTKDFLDIEFNLLTDVLIVNDLRHSIFSLSELFEIIMTWLTNNFNNRKIHLSELMRCADFSSMSFKDVQNFICKDEITAKLSECELRDLVDDIILRRTPENQETMADNVGNQCLSQTKGRIVMVQLFSSSIKIFDPCTGKWESIPFENKKYIYCSTVYKERMYLCHSSFLHFYDFKDKRWEKITSVNDCDDIQALGDHVYIFSGSKCLRICLRTHQFKDLSPMNIKRRYITFITFGRHIYAIGGCIDGGSSTVVERYDPETDQWTSISGMQNSRYAAAAVVLNNKIYICGGKDSDSCLNSVECYDPETNRWESAAPMNDKRSFCVVGALAGKLWALGGRNDDGNVSTIEVYDPSKGTWSRIDSMEENLGCVIGGVIFNKC